MRNELESRLVCCPYCWQNFTLVVDCSVAEQQYVEDCEVCCRPIVFVVHVLEDGVAVEARHEDAAPGDC